MRLNCELCNRPFEQKSGRQRFCNPGCRYQAKRLHNQTEYGPAHRRLRRAVARVVAAGEATSRCGEAILSGDEWHLDHQDSRLGYRGPSHADCNTGARPKRKPFEYWQDEQERWWRADYQGVPVRASRHW